MKPERHSKTLLGITRSKAKMYEFGVPLDGSGYDGALENNPSKASEIVRWHIVRQYDPHGNVQTSGVASPVNVVVYRHFRDGNVVYRERALWDSNGNPVAKGEGDVIFKYKIEGWEN